MAEPYELAAIKFVEEYTGIGLSSLERTEYVDGGGRILYTLRAPITDVESITDIWTNQIIDEDDYIIDEVSGKIILRYGLLWGAGAGRFQVVYTAGYGDEGGAVIPSDLQFVIDAIAQELAGEEESGGNYQSERLGDYSYNKMAGTQAFSTYRQLLETYKRFIL